MVEVMMQSVDTLPDLDDFLRRPDWQARSCLPRAGHSDVLPRHQGPYLETR